MKAGATRKGPRSQPLPGMERVRNKKLDHLCEDIAEARSSINAQHGVEKGALQGAQRVMHDNKISVYKHGGVELALIPGTEKVRARLVKEDGDAEVGGGRTSAENTGGEEPEPEPAGEGGDDDAGEAAEG